MIASPKDSCNDITTDTIERKEEKHLKISKHEEKIFDTPQMKFYPFKLSMHLGAAAYQLGNTSSRTITEVKQR